MTHTPNHTLLHENIQHALSVSNYGTAELLPEEEWVNKLKKSEKTQQPLRIKLGLDPTAPDIHLGHTVVLNKMRQLQLLGHQAIFLIGDFTSTIGDPSGRNTTRPLLTRSQIVENANTYYQQAIKILDPEQTDIQYNSQWYHQSSATDILKLTTHYTLARVLERDDFAKRHGAGQPIGIHELLYPLLQGYDSVALRSDLELGGTDQKFNLLVGRHLQTAYGQEAQCILTMPLLEGLDGVEKMSKSKGNYISITEDANTMFSKVFSISDDLMWRWYPLLSFQSASDIENLRTQVATGLNPKEAKLLLAKEITTRFHGNKATEAALEDFYQRTRGGIPEHLPLHPIGGAPLGIGYLLKATNLVRSIGEGNRLIDGGGVRVDSVVVSDKGLKLDPGTYILQVGKRKFVKVVLSS